MVIIQWPNKSILVAMVFIVIAHITHGNWHNAAWLIGNASLAIWALMEIFSGVNWFRRVLGSVIMLGIISSAIKFFTS